MRAAAGRRMDWRIPMISLFIGLSCALADGSVPAEQGSIEWFIEAVRRLPPDEPVEGRRPGYNKYQTQKDHWLGWLETKENTGTYLRKTAPGRDARWVYNHIVEPKMLLWLIRASGVRPELVQAAARAAEGASSLAGKSAAIRRQVPWPEVAAALTAFKSEPDEGLLPSVK